MPTPAPYPRTSDQATTQGRTAAGGQGAFLAATGRDPESSPDQQRYKRYQHDLIRPFCGPSVLEVGAGTGEFAATLLDVDAPAYPVRRYVVTDLDPDCVARMADRFAGRPEVLARQIDVDGTVDLDEPVDTVVAVNVLEHIEDDAAALAGLAGLVRPGGTVVLWVPGYPALYGDFDARVGHWRRYTPGTLRAAFDRAGLPGSYVRPVNLLGGLAWWAAVKRGGAQSPDPRLVRLYDRFLVPATRFAESLVPVPFGQTVLGVVRVPR